MKIESAAAVQKLEQNDMQKKQLSAKVCSFVMFVQT